MPEENVAVPRHGACVLVGEVKSALLDGDSKNYDMEKGFSRHPIDDGDRGIVVKLGMPCIINRINMLLWDRDQRAYSASKYSLMVITKFSFLIISLILLYIFQHRI